ncbi:DUF2809 domain-containing protein [Clostridium perfringens]|uniref:ribosomal maturation YjgA family protein n=3 Tax=Clostridium perfringens TaxID=1502 RepID=UPI0024BD52D8|nr:DUF2809 domain-containing protein [Clostridium perfringens]
MLQLSKINKRYLAIFLILLIIEVFIALFVHDNFIRPYIGDVLVVIVIYTFIRGIIGRKIKNLPIYIFLFGVLVEVLQYFRIVELLHLQNSRFFTILIGTSFDVKDIICYFVGTLILIFWEVINKE